MAIINNTVSDIGDTLIIKTQVPIVGLTALTSFIDSVVGTTGTRFFTKEFRYAVDGINFSSWIPLTIPNLTAITPNSLSPFSVEYRYTRAGSDPTGLLEFDFVELEGTIATLTCGPAYNDSPFALFFGCHDGSLFGWCLNVLEKIYQLGIVPKYIERNQDGNANQQDDDYLDFFRSITCFFSYLVNYARVYENFQSNQQLLYEYLTQRGMYICPNDPDQAEMQYLMEYFFDEIRKRGTVQIAEIFGTVSATTGVLNPAVGIQIEITADVPGSKSNGITITGNGVDTLDVLVSQWNTLNPTRTLTLKYTIGSSYIVPFGDTFTLAGGGGEVNGELLRLICYGACNEFVFRLTSQYEIGWTIDNSSPLYQGFQGFRSLTKGYEFSAEVQYLSNYPLQNPSKISIVNDPLVGFNVLRLQGPTPSPLTSIGNVLDETKRIAVDINVDYEVSFFVKQSALLRQISFYIWGFDAVGNTVPLINMNTSNASSIVFEQQQLNQVDRYYKVTGIVRKFGSTTANPTLDIGFGSEMKMPSNVCSIMPQIANDATFGVNNIFIYDIKIRPLQESYSLGFVQSSSIIMGWLKNNNGQYSTDQIQDIVRQYLIPLNTTAIYNWL